MPKIKDIKKDIRFLCEQLIIDSLEVANLLGKEKQKETLELISEIAVFHNDLVSRVNHPDGKENPKLIKAYYKSVIDDLLSGSNTFYDRLNKMLPPGK